MPPQIAAAAKKYDAADASGSTWNRSTARYPPGGTTIVWGPKASLECTAPNEAMTARVIST